MQIAKLKSIVVKTWDGQSVEIDRDKLKMDKSGFVYFSDDGDLFIPLCGLTHVGVDAKSARDSDDDDEYRDPRAKYDDLRSFDAQWTPDDFDNLAADGEIRRDGVVEVTG